MVCAQSPSEPRSWISPCTIVFTSPHPHSAHDNHRSARSRASAGRQERTVDASFSEAALACRRTDRDECPRALRLRPGQVAPQVDRLQAKQLCCQRGCTQARRMSRGLSHRLWGGRRQQPGGRWGPRPRGAQRWRLFAANGRLSEESATNSHSPSRALLHSQMSQTQVRPSSFLPCIDTGIAPPLTQELTRTVASERRQQTRHRWQEPEARAVYE